MAEGKKKRRFPVALVIILPCLLAGIFVFTAFWYPGFLKDKKIRKVEQVMTRSTEYDGQHNTEALTDYANRLEEAGNTEAAQKVRELIPKAAQGETAYEAKTIEEVQIIRDSQDINGIVGERR